MLWGLFLCILSLCMLLPVQLGADIHMDERKLARLRTETAGLQREWLVELIATPQGHRLIVVGSGEQTRSISASNMGSGPADRALKLLWDARRARRFLLQHIHPRQADALLLLHTSSAAATALLTGVARLLPAWLPIQWRKVARIRVQPDFLLDHSTLQARCIFSLRLGTILITACLLLAEHAAQAINRREQAIWNTPSEN